MKAFLIRIGFILPTTIYMVFLLMIVIGFAASAFGAASTFYCTVYCKLGVSLLVGFIIAMLYCQARDCFMKP